MAGRQTEHGWPCRPRRNDQAAACDMRAALMPGMLAWRNGHAAIMACAAGASAGSRHSAAMGKRRLQPAH